MTWSISKGGPADEVLSVLNADQNIPLSIKDYIGDGIDGLKTRYGADVNVTVSGSGHLHNGDYNNWDNTTANLTVSRSS